MVFFTLNARQKLATSTPDSRTPFTKLGHQLGDALTNAMSFSRSYSLVNIDSSLYMTTTHFIWLGCGLAEMAIGALLMVGLIVSVYDADSVLIRFFGLDARKLGPSRACFWYPTIAGNSFAQAAVAFGMHAYADLANGWEQVKLSLDTSPKRVPLPKTVTLWNSTRFVISFLWLLKLVDGMVLVHGTDFFGWPAPVLVRSLVFMKQYG